MSKRWSVIITLCFFLPLAGLGLYSALDKDAVKSEEENRALTQQPPFSLSALFQGDWTANFTEYYTDQFPWREALVSAGQKWDNFLYITLPEEDNVRRVGF